MKLKCLRFTPKEEGNRVTDVKADLLFVDTGLIVRNVHVVVDRDLSKAGVTLPASVFMAQGGETVITDVFEFQSEWDKAEFTVAAFRAVAEAATETIAEVLKNAAVQSGGTVQ